MHERYQTRGKIDDMDLAIQYFQQAIEATPDDHPERADRIGDLGGALG